METTRRGFMKTAGAAATGIAAGGGGAMAGNEGEPESVAWSRRIPVRYGADVAVIGGGISGVTAALAAAQAGAKVCLVERFAVTGGNATVGGVASFCGETAGQGVAFDTILSAMAEWGAIEPYGPYEKKHNRKFNHEILAVVLQELLLRARVKVLLHTDFVDVCVDDSGMIEECIVSGPSGPEALRAKQFVDTTGEALVVHRAGFETVKGRPEDSLQLPMSLMYFIRHVEEKDVRAEVPEGWFGKIRSEEDLPMTSIWPGGPGGNAIKIKIPMYDATNTESLTAAEIQARRRMMEVLDYHQRVEERKWLLDHCSGRIGIREGRRILGDYVLVVDDLRAGREFEDAIARGTFYLDGHKPDDDKRTYILPKDSLDVPPYQIPFRCLLPKGSRNLLAAGRCLSADQLALSSARVMTTCSMMGQAAGLAAAMAASGGCSPRELDPLKVRQETEKWGAWLSVHENPPVPEI